MTTNTKTLFASVLKAAQADCVCDIGSRDGDQSLFFRHLLPEAVVVAFEANPLNFAMMQANENLTRQRIELVPCAVAGAKGTAKFHVSDVDYSNPEENRGTSSLLIHDQLKIRESVEVETQRIDDFILTRHPSVQRIGLWIDVEGVEYPVLEGMERIKDRVVAVHVETARVPLRRGQQTFVEVSALMERLGFVYAGSNMNVASTWGDAVFVQRQMKERLGWRYSLARVRARAAVWLKVDHLAVFLKKHCHPLYAALRRIYIRLGT